ncbi:MULTISPECIES: phosphoribosylamine--glycine ligase [Heyndrickxia]|uniref:phosphoribosylamine--glycine ligase n=1 Tax=Heyndrickxia TaxID=2837504 RepID=UPI002E1A19FD|nr:phosphoribosylamine--glycine ligase [Weizmannia sp. CD-2023]MED4867057.1 phosphoribosylamine--glycine ligase [Weizmannia sp. CD-2023]MED4891313.1 phosphoribosylamine--glycine ligase [Weizmannia sp. CD-2023]
MKVLVIGSGGREHAVCKKLLESARVDKIYCAPGNGGIAQIAEIVPIHETDTASLLAFAKDKGIELTVVGPEAPLSAGIVDEFQNAGLKIFGPTKQAARIESSKAFAKELMQKYDIPTADYRVFSDYAGAEKYIEEKGVPIVIKADGLAAGKGVTVAMTPEEAKDALRAALIGKKFGEASNQVVVEEFLKGEEFSLMAFVREEEVYPMVIARDHKRAYDGDSGPNTGGMGAYSPVPQIPDEEVKKAVEHILRPAARALKEEGCPFTGVLYAGLMLTKKGVKVIEFNARFGDPETEVVLERLESDLAEIFLDLLDDKTPSIKWRKEAVLGVVIAANGYPDTYEKGIPIPSLSKLQSFVFHAGTRLEGERLVSNGGRVLFIGRRAGTLEEARKALYHELERLRLDGFFYRRDIGKRHQA